MAIDPNMYEISLQATVGDVIADVEAGVVAEETFWINFIPDEKIEDGEAIEKHVNVKRSGKADDGLIFETTGDLVFTRKSSHQFLVSYNDVKYELQLPQRKISIEGVEPCYTSFDISPSNDRFLIGTDSGDLKIGNLRDGKIIKTIEGAHHSTILHSMFFPSGKVALTAGLDLQIKIWDVINGYNARTFTGHTQRITGLTMIERGKNFLSSSKDGTIILWDCASGTSISTMVKKNSIHDAVNAIVTVDNGHESAAEIKAPNEVGTEGKHLLAGHESGVITVFDLPSKSQISSFSSLNSEVVALSASNQRIAAGYVNGTVAIWDKQNVETPLHRVKKGAEIKSLDVGPNGDVFVSYGSGFVQIWDANGLENSSVKRVLIGVGNSEQILSKFQGDKFYRFDGSTIYEYVFSIQEHQ